MTVYVIFNREKNQPHLSDIDDCIMAFLTEAQAQEWINEDTFFCIKEMRLEEIK